MLSLLDRALSWGREVVRSTCFYVVTFVDGGFESISDPFLTKDAAALYSRGFVSGAGKYGAGSVRAFVLPNEHADLVEYGDNTGVDIKPALAAMGMAIEGRLSDSGGGTGPGGHCG